MARAFAAERSGLATPAEGTGPRSRLTQASVSDIPALSYTESDGPTVSAPPPLSDRWLGVAESRAIRVDRDAQIVWFRVRGRCRWLPASGRTLIGCLCPGLSPVLVNLRRPAAAKVWSARSQASARGE